MSVKVVEAKDLKKTYQMGMVEVHALRGVSLTIDKGEILAIMGPSGSGKSTLMHLLGCLDKPTSGKYILNSKDVSRMDGNELAQIRNKEVGFVFQSYNLLPRLTAMANVMLPLNYVRGEEVKDGSGRATELLAQVGLKERIHHKPVEMSGGEQQRVAIARALVNQPSILLADEPTGNLDSKSGKEIMDLLIRINKDRGVTLIIVTHAMEVARLTHRLVQLEDGMVKNDH
jgi:putative ABC transport system ATP-binding protein